MSWMGQSDADGLSDLFYHSQIDGKGSRRERESSSRHSVPMKVTGWDVNIKGILLCLAATSASLVSLLLTFSLVENCFVSRTVLSDRESETKLHRFLLYYREGLTADISIDE